MTEEQKLFHEWRNKHPGEAFAEDGIIDPEHFGQRGPKVLFVLKETSVPAYVDHGSLTKWLLSEEPNYQSTWYNIARWAGAMLGTPLRQANLGRAQEILRGVAAININKFGHRTRSSGAAILKQAREDADLLRRQIDLIEPEVIVGCGVTQALHEILNVPSPPPANVLPVDGVGKIVGFPHRGRFLIFTRHPNRAHRVHSTDELSAAWQLLRRT